MGVGVWTKLAEGAVDETAQWLWVCVALEELLKGSLLRECVLPVWGGAGELGDLC